MLACLRARTCTPCPHPSQATPPSSRKAHLITSLTWLPTPWRLSFSTRQGAQTRTPPAWAALSPLTLLLGSQTENILCPIPRALRTPLKPLTGEVPRPSCPVPCALCRPGFCYRRHTVLKLQEVENWRTVTVCVCPCPAPGVPSTMPATP